jgi:hypothetical protein
VFSAEKAKLCQHRVLRPVAFLRSIAARQCDLLYNVGVLGTSSAYWSYGVPQVSRKQLYSRFI